ncbi:hypothetical protein Bhyg_10627, partial [Pseudolycoriella hygida]
LFGKTTDASTTSSTTFQVSNKAVERVKESKENESKDPICSQLREYSGNHCTEVLMESPFSPNVRPTGASGFIKTVIKCYNNHHNLVIRPDDIWTAILTQFSFYINKNAEKFRSQFVNFDGKKELVVKMGGSLRDAQYDLFVSLMTQKIDENLVDKTVKDWILPNFTTTTPNDVITCGVIFMAVTKKYFDFTCCLSCGIPKITLEGTVADWEDILNRLEKLNSYKVGGWYNMLKLILEEFVAAKNGKVNKKFWNQICNRFGGGSGPTYISGWLTAFAVFDEDGNWTNHGRNKEKDEESPWPSIDMDKIPTGVVTVPVKIVDLCTEYESMMFAGHVGYVVPKDGYTLKPEIGWGIAVKMSEEKVVKYHETVREQGEWYCDLCHLRVKQYEVEDED